MIINAIHTYNAILMHNGIEVRASAPTKHAALTAAVEKWEQNRKATEEGAEYCKRIGDALLAEWRNETRRHGTPLRMALERPKARVALERI